MILQSSTSRFNMLGQKKMIIACLAMNVSVLHNPVSLARYGVAANFKSIRFSATNSLLLSDLYQKLKAAKAAILKSEDEIRD